MSSNGPVRKPLALIPCLAAVMIAVAAGAAAVSVRNCPGRGDCSWDVVLGAAAAAIALVAGAAGCGFARRAAHGADDTLALVLLLASFLAGVGWSISFLVRLA